MKEVIFIFLLLFYLFNFLFDAIEDIRFFDDYFRNHF